MRNNAFGYGFSIVMGAFISICLVLAMYFMGVKWYYLPIVAVLDIVIVEFVTERTFSYMSAFAFLFTMELIGGTVTLLAYLGIVSKPLPYNRLMVFMLLVHHLAIFLCCTIKYIADYGLRVLGYQKYFWCAGICLWILVITVFVFKYFIAKECFPFEGRFDPIIPFANYADAVEAIIGGELELGRLLKYSFEYIAFFLPVGFYVHVLFGRRRLPVRLLFFIGIPAIIEGVQYLLFRPMFCADDAVMGLVGCLIGSMFYAFINHYYKSNHGVDILKRPDRVSFYH